MHLPPLSWKKFTLNAWLRPVKKNQNLGFEGASETKVHKKLLITSGPTRAYIRVIGPSLPNSIGPKNHPSASDDVVKKILCSK